MHYLFFVHYCVVVAFLALLHYFSRNAFVILLLLPLLLFAHCHSSHASAPSSRTYWPNSRCFFVCFYCYISCIVVAFVSLDDMVLPLPFLPCEGWSFDTKRAPKVSLFSIFFIFVHFLVLNFLHFICVVSFDNVLIF
jgi:hypothetical protein